MPGCISPLPFGTGILVIALAGALFPAPAHSGDGFPELGGLRLFMTPQERQVAEHYIDSAEVPAVDINVSTSDLAELEASDPDETHSVPVVTVSSIGAFYNGLVLAADGRKSVWVNGERYVHDQVSGLTLLSVSSDGVAIFRGLRKVQQVHPGRSFSFMRIVAAGQ